MNIKQLQSFLVLCDELHYGRAADRLFITQPSLSQQIKQLESSLKIILFKRKGRGIELTKAGGILQQHAIKIMLSLKNAENDLQPYLHQKRDTIALGVSGSHLVLPMFRSFISQHPEISLNVKEFSTAETIKKLGDGAIDIGIVYQREFPPHLTSTVLFDDEIILAVPVTHPLAKRNRITFEDLNDVPVIMLNDSLLLREVVTKELTKNKITPNIICELDNHYSCLEYAEAQIGIAFITRSLFRTSPAQNVHLVSLAVPSFFHPVVLLHNKDLLLDEPTRYLLRQIKDFYTSEASFPIERDGLGEK